MFREMVVRGLTTGGGREAMRGVGEGVDFEGGNASNVKIEGVACSSTRLGNRLGELNGEATVGVSGEDCCLKRAEQGECGEGNGEWGEGNGECGEGDGMRNGLLILLR